MIRLTTLDNGLRVVTRAMPSVETAAVGLFADSGSRHEPAEFNGLAHLYEHMVFKGAGGRSAREISEAIEDVGGELNACTEREGTSFTAAVMAEHLSIAVELIADLVQRPHLAPADLELEKEVVLQELAEVMDTPSDLIFDELWAAAFADQPIGRSILGDESSIERIQVGDLDRWRQHRFLAGGMILAAAGKVDHDDVVTLAENRLGGLQEGCASEGIAARFTSAARIARAPSEQAHLTLALAAPKPLDADFLAARLFADAVGGGASSRLFQSVREERGLAYSVSATLYPHRDIGLFYIHAATSRRDSAAASQLIEEVVTSAATDLTQRELDRVRTQARAALLMHLETPWGQMSYTARQLATYGRVMEPAEVVEQLAAITLADARSAGSRMLAGPRARATIGVPAVRAA